MLRYAPCMLVVAMGCATTSSAGLAEATAPTVRYVIISGNESFDDDEIVQGLATHPPEGLVTVTKYRYDPLASRADRERIESFYRRRGYFSARVVDVDVKDLGENRVGVRFEVREGAPTRIEEVSITGLPEGFEPTERLELALEDLERGHILRHEDYIEARDRLRAALLARGHAHAQVAGRVRVDREDAAARVLLRTEPGPVVRYGRTRVEGLDRIPESAVLVRVAWERGERFSPEKMQSTRGRLYQLGNFSNVSLDYPQQGAPEVIDVTIRATEGRRQEIRLGGGLAFDNTYFEARGRAGYIVRGLGHPLVNLRADLRPAYRLLRSEGGGDSAPGGEASVSLERVDLFAPRATGLAAGAYVFEEFEDYTIRGPEGRLSWDVPLLDDRLRLAARWQLSDYEITDLDPAITPAVAEEIGAVDPYRLGVFDQSAVVDLRDSLLDPTRGLYAELRLEESGTFAGGLDRFEYIKVTGELRGYVPVTDRLVLAARGRLGAAVTGSLPLTQRYFSGGASRHRGFGQRRLSPTVSDGDSSARIGGDALLESSAEIRADITRVREEWLGVTAFVDAGDVTLEPDDLALGDLFWAVGAGLRYDTLIGPIRVDVGYRLTDITGPPGPRPQDRLVFHLSIGEAF